MTTKEKVLAELEKSGDKYISGGRLGRNLGLSRNSVWKAVKQLETEGYIIEAVTNKGYRLVRDADIITSEDISAALEEPVSAGKIIVLDSIDSTNNYAKQLAEQGAEHGTIVIANEQTAGKGRMGRTFSSPKNTGIYMSFILRPQIAIEAVQLLTSYLAVIVSDALDSVCGCSTAIKWVNDIMLNDKKICGILTEAAISCESASFRYIIAGIGINTGTVKDAFDPELLEIASSIEDETGKHVKRSELIAAVINRLDEKINSLSSGMFIEEYRRRSWILGRDVIVTKNGKDTEAHAEDIDETAGLIVSYADGTRDIISTGEARIRKKPV